ncbi:hypothetical protein RS030_111719 [Cryptosporidium xiaoi]|uniref:Uncharacterized protein n=1 Tax=Cryptosporidium xiaoi TaxID=659607 RepID=A0AAV9Y2Q2_9CRYT
MNKYDLEFVNLLQKHLYIDECSKIEETLTYTQDYKSSVVTKHNEVLSKGGTNQKVENLEGRSYILHLISSDYPNNLLSEYSSLNIESQKLKDTLQRASLKNSSKIINNNKETIYKVRHNFSDFENSSKNTPLYTSNIMENLSYNRGLITDRLMVYKGLIKLKNIVPKIAELTELPSLVEAFIQSNMMDDALNALEYGKSTIKILEASIFSIPNSNLIGGSDNNIANSIIKKVKINLEMEISRFYKSLKYKLNSNRLSLINTVETIGQLRRLIYLSENNSNLFSTDILYKQLQNNKNGLYTECTLGRIFLDSRSEYINSHYIYKTQTLIGVNNFASLDSAVNLFSSQLVLTLSIFNSIFSKCQNSVLSNYWLNCYVFWFTQICKKSMTLVHYESFKNSICKNTRINQTLRLPIKTIYIALFNLKSIPITTNSCYRIYMHIVNTFSFSRSIQLTILPLFENYVIEYYRKLLEYSLEIFVYEMKEYTDNLEKYSFSKNIKPFEVLHNEFIHIINELRLCPFISISTFIADLTMSFLDLVFIETKEIIKKINNQKEYNTSQHDLSLKNDVLHDSLPKFLNNSYMNFHDDIIHLITSIFNIEIR